MKTLIDTCVISELRTPRCDPIVREVMEQVDDRDIYLSVVSVGELVRGVGLLQPGRRRDELDRWVREVESVQRARILPICPRVARVWGEVDASAKSRGHTIPAPDGMIAATALHHDLPVMTRNTSHFHAAGVRVINPWEGGGILGP